MSDKEIKEILKEALKEWLDEKFAAFGRWSFYGICSMSLVALIYFILQMYGWRQVNPFN